VPSNILFHQPSEREQQAGKLRSVESCLSSIAAPNAISALREVPALWNSRWMLRFSMASVLDLISTDRAMDSDPKSQRFSARMPKVLHGGGARSDAAAVAAFLCRPRFEFGRNRGNAADAATAAASIR
jgi:hypothetical protein